MQQYTANVALVGRIVHKAQQQKTEVRGQLSETEMSDLGFLIITINGWNRLCVAFRTTPGSADAAFGLDKAGLH